MKADFDVPSEIGKPKPSCENFPFFCLVNATNCNCIQLKKLTEEVKNVKAENF
jgi:hypothetical protein